MIINNTQNLWTLALIFFLMQTLFSIPEVKSQPGAEILCQYL